MTASLMTDTSVGGWMLPTSGDTQIQIEKVVAQTTEKRESARPLRTLGVVARRALAEEIETKLRMIMNETLADLVVAGWKSYKAVGLAIQTSAGKPGVEQLAPLHSHTISANRQHNLDIEVDSFPVLSLGAEVKVNLQLYDAVAVAKDGRLVGIRSGKASADGVLTLEGVEVSRKTLVFPLTASFVWRRPPQAAVAAG